MPLYEFRAPDGSVVEEFYRPSEAPRIGETVMIGGLPHVRIPSRINQTNRVLTYTSDRFHESEGAGPEDAAEIERETGAKVTPDGRVDCQTTGQRKAYWKWINRKHRESLKPQPKPPSNKPSPPRFASGS